MQRRLFHINKSPYDGYPRPEMSTFKYYARSTRPDIIKIRDRWEGIFQNCLIPGKRGKNKLSEIYGNFRDKREENHLSAVFELFLYDLFSELGCRFKEPPLVNGNELDYHIVHGNRMEFYLEATCAMGNRLKRKEDRWRDMAMDALNHIKSEKYCASVEFEGECYAAPATGKLIREIEKWELNLIYDQVASFLEQKGTSKIPITKEFNAAGLIIKIEIKSIRKHRPDLTPRLIGFWNIGTTRDNSDEVFEAKFKEKVSQCKGATMPIVIAINYLDGVAKLDSIHQALYKNNSNNFWLRDKKLCNINVHALMMFSRVELGTEPINRPIIILNPYVEKNGFLISNPSFNYFTLSKDSGDLIHICL